MAELIIHADDFGLSKKVNEGILTAFTKGTLTSTSIMAVGAEFDHALRIYKSNSNIDVGVHLTLIEEKPILHRNIIKTLVNSKNRLHNHARVFVKLYFMKRICLQEVEQELEAQVLKVKQCGIKVSHLDSHQHLHMLPQILKITMRIAKKYGIPVIRFPLESAQFYMLKRFGSYSRFFQLLILNWFCWLGRSKIELRTKHFAGFLYSGNLNKQNLLEILHKLPATGTCELMCHPGLHDPDTRYAHWGYNWQEEFNALIDPEISRYIQDNEIKLISYRQFV